MNRFSFPRPGDVMPFEATYLSENTECTFLIVVWFRSRTLLSKVHPLLQSEKFDPQWGVYWEVDRRVERPVRRLSMTRTGEVVRQLRRRQAILSHLSSMKGRGITCSKTEDFIFQAVFEALFLCEERQHTYHTTSSRRIGRKVGRKQELPSGYLIYT